MKKLMLFIGILILSKTAMAMHSYATDECVAKTIAGISIEISLSNDTPMSPHKINTRDMGQIFEGKNLWVDMDKSGQGSDDDSQEISLSLKVLNKRKIEAMKMDDGCFQGQATTSVRIAKISQINEEVAAAYGLKKNQTLAFTCYEDFQFPTGANCGK